MANIIFKITNNKLILTQNTRNKRRNHARNFLYKLKKYYQNMNIWFGIEENVSDQVWFYGFFIICCTLLLFTYLISGFLFGF
ncbi:hypothetical protein BK704_12510 [[Bacillus thuringiensis] serovar konkukian]|nr:hypothetical protein BK704_12510 [[Bacillus thuringiensis] serovar konkukian]